MVRREAGRGEEVVGLSPGVSKWIGLPPRRRWRDGGLGGGVMVGGVFWSKTNMKDF